jgi:hypothetical protein
MYNDYMASDVRELVGASGKLVLLQDVLPKLQAAGHRRALLLRQAWLRFYSARLSALFLVSILYVFCGNRSSINRSTFVKPHRGVHEEVLCLCQGDSRSFPEERPYVADWHALG